MQNPPPGYQRVSPYLLYEDASSAIEYLQSAFGFELRHTATGAAGRLHAELLLGPDGLVMLGQAGEGFSSPRTLDVSPSVQVHVYVDDVEALHGRASAAGADVTDLELSPAGDRRFAATDLEGNVWWFAQRVEAHYVAAARARSCENRWAISSAPRAASAARPIRDSACSRVSVVSTPNATGTPVSIPAS